MSIISKKFKAFGTCIACGKRGIIDLHHIKSRKSGGSDCTNNLLELCRAHHVEIHQIGRTTFIKKYRLEYLMNEKGWEFDTVSNKWINITME